MYFDNKTYSILIVSSSEKMNSSLDPLLPRSYYNPVTFTSSISSAQRRLAERNYDFIIINSPLPDDMGIRMAIDICSKRYSSCLILAAGSIYEDIRSKVTDHGIFILPKPINQNIFQTALSWLASSRERMRRFERTDLTIEEKMAEIRTISRAKILLIEHENLSEEAAHKYIEKNAMDKCVTKLSIAKEILDKYS